MITGVYSLKNHLSEINECGIGVGSPASNYLTIQCEQLMKSVPVGTAPFWVFY